MQEPTAKEVLVLDSNTFIREIGLTSDQASALKHYLYARGTQLAVPQVVVQECERHLQSRAAGKVESVRKSLEWLSHFLGRVGGWTPPEQEALLKKTEALSRGEAFQTVILQPTPELQQRAEVRDRLELPPGHKKHSLNDCLIWEHCMDLLKDHDVILVSGNTQDFCGHQRSDELHPQLRREAEDACRRLTFYTGVPSLLSELSADIEPPTDQELLEFLYEEAAVEAVMKLKENSGCQPTFVGPVHHELFTTDQNKVVEVRVRLNDMWESNDGRTRLEFSYSGKCLYRLSDRKLCEPRNDVLRLTETLPGGTKRSIKGSYAYARLGTIYAGPAPIEAKSVNLGTATGANERPGTG